VLNLLSNAIKFTPCEGCSDIPASNIDPINLSLVSYSGQVHVTIKNGKKEPEKVEVSVKDSGIGIPKNLQSHLFGILSIFALLSAHCIFLWPYLYSFLHCVSSKRASPNLTPLSDTSMVDWVWDWPFVRSFAVLWEEIFSVSAKSTRAAFLCSL